MRKDKLILGSIVLAVILVAGISSDSHACAVIIDEVTDSFTVGDFQVFGNNRGSCIGTACEILKFSPVGCGCCCGSSGGASDGVPPDLGPNGDLSIADIQDVFHNDFGINSTEKFVFGLDVHQTPSRPMIRINSLVLSIAQGNIVHQFTLGGTRIWVSENTIGDPAGNIAEVLFEVDLGFDFMQLNSTGPGDFTLYAHHSRAVGDPEEYYIDQAFFGGPGGVRECPVIPEPASMMLLGSGLFGLIGLRRKKAL